MIDIYIAKWLPQLYLSKDRKDSTERNHILALSGTWPGVQRETLWSLMSAEATISPFSRSWQICPCYCPSNGPWSFLSLFNCNSFFVEARSMFMRARLLTFLNILKISWAVSLQSLITAPLPWSRYECCSFLFLPDKLYSKMSLLLLCKLFPTRSPL